MFKFFTKRWVSRKDYEEKEQELKSVKLAKEELYDKFFTKWGELSEIINGKEKTIQRLESMLMDDVKVDQEAWVIPFCISELEKLNKKLAEYTPFNPELKKLTIEEVICRLAQEMQTQNSIMAQALLALNLKKPVNIENNA